MVKGNAIIRDREEFINQQRDNLKINVLKSSILKSEELRYITYYFYVPGNIC